MLSNTQSSFTQKVLQLCEVDNAKTHVQLVIINNRKAFCQGVSNEI